MKTRNQREAQKLREALFLCNTHHISVVYEQKLEEERETEALEKRLNQLISETR